jgi:small subunit ribosomal protein S9
MPRTNKVSSFKSSKGGRKTALASAWLWEKAKAPVSGITVNGKEAGAYFHETTTADSRLTRPFQVCNVVGRYAVSARVSGGGKNAQLDSVVLAIARTLAKQDENYKSLLRKEGLLTRDSRMVQSKTYYHHGARRAQQFSKR